MDNQEVTTLRNFDRLEVGEWYQARNGILVNIVDYDYDPNCDDSYIGSDNRRWCSNGNFLPDDTEHIYDLVLHIEQPMIVPKKRKVPKGRVLYRFGDELSISEEAYTEKEFNIKLEGLEFIRIINEVPELPVEYVEE